MTRIDRRFVRRCILGLMLIALGAPAVAQNLIINPGFNVDLNDWELLVGFEVTQIWSPIDTAGDTSSGSLYSTLAANGPFRSPPVASQCIAITPDRDYVFGADALLPSATTTGNSDAQLSVEFHALGNCTGPATGVAFSSRVTATDAWTLTEGEFHSSPTEVSVRVLLNISAPPAIFLGAHFDDVFVMQPELLFRDGFED